MSIYSNIDRKINGDAWFRGLPKLSQLLWFRLLTGRHVTPVAGLWAANEDGLAREFGYSMKEFRESFQELSKEPSSNGFKRVISDWEAGLIWVPKAIEIPCNQPANFNVLSSWGPYVELLPECNLKSLAIQSFRTWSEQHLNRYKKVPCWLVSCCAVVGSQEQEQEQEQYIGGTVHEQDPTRGIDLGQGPDLPLPKQAKKNGKANPKETNPPADLIANPATLAEAQRLGTRWEDHWRDCSNWFLSVGKKRVDWQATLRNWMAKEPAKYPLNGHGAQTTQPKSQASETSCPDNETLRTTVAVAWCAKLESNPEDEMERFRKAFARRTMPASEWNGMFHSWIREGIQRKVQRAAKSEAPTATITNLADLVGSIGGNG